MKWRTWYSTIKVTAKSLGVWKYLDPDASNPEKIPEARMMPPEALELDPVGIRKEYDYS
jgi:hypothetical protein